MFRDEDNNRKRKGTDLHLPELPSLWSLSAGDPNVCVAVLDDPTDFGHPCFDGALPKQVRILGFVGDDRGMALRHGTHVASLVFGQHESPVRGIAPGCRGVIIPVFRERGDGSIVPCSQLDLARAISMAVSVGANIINISGGRNDPTGQPEPVLMRAIDLCAQQGILIVASAGNDGCACPHVPGAAESVLVVGAMNAAGEPMEFSNWAQAYLGHGVLGPGDGIEGAAPDGGTASYSGTSFATPFVSGVAALLMSMQLKTGRPADVQAVRRAILDIQPAGPFADEVYKRLAQFLREQREEGVSQISISGYVAASTTLMNGQEVPVIVPDIRGMCSWSTPAVVEAVLGQRPAGEEDQATYDAQAGEVAGFLDRVYYELSNVGVSPQERAINFAATNA